MSGLLFLEQLRQILERYYQEESLKASTMHQHLRMSRSALFYKLKKHTGCSAAEFLANYRIGKAQTLLMESEESIKEIAFRVGFRDPNYFCRVFKKQTGIAPRNYRILNDKNNSPDQKNNSANERRG